MRSLREELERQKDKCPQDPWYVWLILPGYLLTHWRDVIKAFLPENLDAVS